MRTLIHLGRFEDARKPSSGLRINTAADGAAGLSSSQKLRAKRIGTTIHFSSKTLPD